MTDFAALPPGRYRVSFEANYLGADSAKQTPWAILRFRTESRAFPAQIARVPVDTPGLTVQPADADTPAEEWELVTADQVRVGDEIEHGRFVLNGPQVVTRGLVTDMGQVDEGRRRWVWLGDEDHGFKIWLGVRVEREEHVIRRRVRAPMPEPDAPAVVRHAGKVFAKGIRSGWWHCLSEEATGGRVWSEVLALDPASDPVPVDLGGGA